jgi:hypothetical protein
MMVALSLSLALAAAPAEPNERTVTKASVYLVKSPSFLASRVSPVAVYRNEKVKLEGAPQGSWYLVSYQPRKGPKITGYMHVSYLSDRPVAFRVENKEVEGRGQVSGNYNLAVPGFRQEIAQNRQRSNKDAAAGYRAIEKYMPLDHAAAANTARLSSPPDAKVLLAFLHEGRLREPAPPRGRAAVAGRPQSPDSRAVTAKDRAP